MLVPFISYIILYFSFINYLRGGILDPKLSSSFLLIFLFVCIVYANGQNPCLFEQSLFLSIVRFKKRPQTSQTYLPTGSPGSITSWERPGGGGWGGSYYYQPGNSITRNSSVEDGHAWFDKYMIFLIRI